MLWEIGEFEFLLQALKFGIWDVNLVRGDWCWHCMCYVLLVYVSFRKGRKRTCERRIIGEKTKNELRCTGNLGKWRSKIMG